VVVKVGREESAVSGTVLGRQTRTADRLLFCSLGIRKEESRASLLWNVTTRLVRIRGEEFQRMEAGNGKIKLAQDYM